MRAAEKALNMLKINNFDISKINKSKLLDYYNFSYPQEITNWINQLIKKWCIIKIWYGIYSLIDESAWTFSDRKKALESEVKRLKIIEKKYNEIIKITLD